MHRTIDTLPHTCWYTLTPTHPLSLSHTLTRTHSNSHMQTLSPLAFSSLFASHTLTLSLTHTDFVSLLLSFSLFLSLSLSVSCSCSLCLSLFLLLLSSSLSQTRTRKLCVFDRERKHTHTWNTHEHQNTQTRQCGAAWCSVAQLTATKNRGRIYYNTRQHTATHCNILSRTASCCTILHHAVTHWNTSSGRSDEEATVTTHYNTLPKTTTHCSTHTLSPPPPHPPSLSPLLSLILSSPFSLFPPPHSSLFPSCARARFISFFVARKHTHSGQRDRGNINRKHARRSHTRPPRCPHSHYNYER